MKVIHNLSAYARKPALVPMYFDPTDEWLYCHAQQRMLTWLREAASETTVHWPIKSLEFCVYDCLRKDAPGNTVFTRTWLLYVRVFAIANPFVCRLSVVCNVRAPYSQAAEPFDNISSPLSTLAILWLSRKISRRSSQGNPSVGGIKCKRGSK